MIPEEVRKHLLSLAQEVLDTMINAASYGELEDVRGWADALAIEIDEILDKAAKGEAIEIDHILDRVVEGK